MARSLPRVIPNPLEKIELLDYSKGINSFDANDVVDKTYWRYATDARISTLGRYTTRKGCDFYTVPIGETADTQQTSVTGASDGNVGLATRLAAKYVATGTGRLTKVDLNFKNSAAATGTIIVEIQSNDGSEPSGTVMASSSIPASSPTSSYAYISVRFIEAPQVAAATTYWIVCYIQDDGSGLYKWSSTTNATTALSTTDSGTTWASTAYDLNYKTYISTDSPTLGIYRAYKSDGTKKTLLAHGTSVYSVSDVDGSTTAIKTGLTASGTYRFATANDVIYYVNGVNGPRKWDFTTEASNPGTTTVSNNIILHKDQMMYVDATSPTRVFFSDKGDFETFTSTNFFYVPSPKTADPITGWAVLNDNLYIFTRRTKWALYGSDLSNFVLRRSTGLKGTWVQENIQSTRNHIYFVAEDGIYRFNGATDELISKEITDEFNSIADLSDVTTALHNNRFYLFYTTSGASNNKCLVYNINYGSWESIDKNTYVGFTSHWDGSSDNSSLIAASNLVGAAYYSELSTNTYNNLGKQLEFEVRTRYEFFENPASKKRVKRWYPRFAGESGSYNVSCQYDKDFANNPTTSLQSLAGSGTTWGSGGTWGSGLTWGTTANVSPRISIPGRAKYIQFRLKRTGVDNPVEFYGHTLLYMTQRPR